MLNYTLVTTDEALESACQLIKGSLLAVDTEFVRVSTYYPKVGLIQLFDGEQLLLIDPLTIKNWQPLITLFIDQRITKVLHAGSEDIGVFMHLLNLTPAPIFDTQIAANFLGYPQSIGFASLVQECLSLTLNKDATRTDWVARPLTKEQCHYAAADVFYLFPVAQLMLERLRNSPLADSIHEECNAMVKKCSQILSPDNAYLSIMYANQLNSSQLAYLQKIAAWRLNYAREQDKPVNFVIKEKMAWKLALHHPSTEAQFQQIGLNRQEIHAYGTILLAILNDPIPESMYLNPIILVTNYPHYKTHYKQIKNHVEQASASSHLPTALIASRKQINNYIQWWNLPNKEGAALPDLLTGWRNRLLKIDDLVLVH